MNSETIPAPTYRLVGYFPSWGIHAQNYHVTDIPAGRLTHVIYAFANVTATGDCVSTNPADDQVNFPQLRQLKQQHPNLHILISVGGAANSPNFPAAVANQTILLHFAQSCVQFMKVNGFDGIDIDWEYPTAAQTQSFTALLVELRHELDALGAITKRPYVLTIAAPAGSSNYAHLQLGQIHQYLDWIDVMAYDFTVVSSFVTDFVAPLEAYDSSIARHAASNAAAAVQAYLQAGVPASKLVLGTRFIGTGWQGVTSSNNGLYQSNHGPAKGTWDAAGVPPTGSFGYQDVAQNYVSNTSRFWHVDAEVPWVFLPATGVMISYEDPQSLALKASYITATGLAGAMIWELGADDAQHALVNSLADALTPSAGLTTYTATGTVISPDSASVVGLLVQLVDKTVGPDVPLGLTTTNAGGQYQISVGISPTTLQGRLKTAPDLQVRVFTGQTFLVASAVRYNASANETINVTLPANVTALPSEYETLTAAIAVNYSGRIGALQENAQRSDITFLANKTGWDARAVAMGALADQFSQASVSSGVAGAGVGPEFYYALFRAGLPADPAVLYRVDLTTVSSTWQQAIDRGVIPRQLAGGLAAALESFRNIAALQILDTTAIQGTSTLRSLLALTLSDAAHQQTFADLYTQHQRDLPTFWSEIQKTFGPDTTRRLQLDGQMAYLTLNSLKLISNLYAAEAATSLTSPLDLVRRGYYQPDKWTPLLAGVPLDPVPGQTDPEKRANYVAVLSAHLRLSYPTAVVAEQVKSGIFPLGVTPQIRDGVYQFFVANQGKFELGLDLIDQYLIDNKLTVDPQVVTQIKRLHRVMQITQDDSPMTALLTQGIDSAYAVVNYGQLRFIRDFATAMGGADVASATFARAQTVHNALLNITHSYLIGRVMPPLGSGGGGIKYIGGGGPHPSQQNPQASATLETLFGNLDYCSCEECRSILGPAAYFVDLLRFTDIPPPPPTGGGAPPANPQDVLFARRPDLQYLPLTCENTNIALPYIDIVNETLEYFAATGSLAGYRGYDTDGSVSSAELLASPQNLDPAAYAMLQTAWFPPPLPFHRSLELLRRLFQQFNVRLADAMAVLRQSEAIERPAASYGWRDILMEEIGLSRPEHRILTDSTLTLAELHGYPSTQTDDTTIAALSSIKDYSRRTGVSYDDLITILQTRFVNLGAAWIARLQTLHVSFTTIQWLQSNPTANRAGFESLWPTGLSAPNPADFGGGKTPDDIVNWILLPQNYSAIMSLIVIANPTNPTDLCSIADLEFRYSNPDNTANRLKALDFLRLLRFIRLWRKLGLTVEQTDALITALTPATAKIVVTGNFAAAVALSGSVGAMAWHYTTPSSGDLNSIASAIAAAICASVNGYGAYAANSVVFVFGRSAAVTSPLAVTATGGGTITLTVGTDPTGDPQLLDAAFLALLPRIGFAYRVAGLLGMSLATDLTRLLACWAPIGTFGANSLYRTMFLNPTLLHQDPAFAPDGAGLLLQDTTQKLFDHELALRGAFNLTHAEFAAIAAAPELKYDASTALTLANISEIYRRAWLARTLQLSVIEFLYLKQFSGLDPFLSPDPAPTPPAEPAVIRLIQLAQGLAQTGLPPVQTLYHVWNQDISGRLTPSLADVLGLAHTLRSDFAAIESQFSLVADPTGSIAKSLMALVYGPTATDFFFGLINNTLTVAVPYSNPQPALAEAILDAASSRLGYDDFAKQLSFAGVLDVVTLSALQSAIVANGNYAPLAQAVSALATANQQAVGPFFTTYPELLPLYTGYAMSIDSPQNKRTVLLANFLPELKRRRKEEQSLTDVTATAGTDPSFAPVLLDNADVLHAGADTAQPAVTDFTAIEAPGLTAQFFLSDALPPPGLPDITIDAVGLSYSPAVIGASQQVTLTGTITAGDSLTTRINGVNIPYTVVSADTTPAILASHIAATINATTTPDPISGLPLNAVVSASAPPGVVSASAPTGAIIVKATNPGTAVTVACSSVLQATPTYIVGAQLPASQSASITGPITAGDVLSTTVNGIAVTYTVAAGDTDATILAARIAATINGTRTLDPVTGLPLNRLVSATAAAGVLTVMAVNFGPAVTLTCSVSTGGTETYQAGPATAASQSVTLAGVVAAGNQVITTINGVPISYTVLNSDHTSDLIASGVAAAINGTTALDPATGHRLNTIVFASSTGSVVTVAAIGPGAAFTLMSSLSLGSYALILQFAVAQTALLAGGITPGDVLTTTINGVSVACTVAGDATVTALAGRIASAVNTTTTPDPETGHPLNSVVSASSVGGVVTVKSLNAAPFTLTCGLSPGATETYIAGPEFPAWQAAVAGGFSAGDILTTTIDGIPIACPVIAGDTTATLAARIATVINGQTKTDPVTGLPLNRSVIASSSGSSILLKAAGSTFTLHCTLSAGATEILTTGGMLPARAGDKPLASEWRGYLTVPQDGFYNIRVESDAGATVTLAIGGTAVTLAASANGSVWTNQSPIGLTSSALSAIALTATAVTDTLVVSWESTGLGWQVIPSANLYSDTLIRRLQASYVRFVKAASLATGLSLTSGEIAYLAADANYQINQQGWLNALAVWGNSDGATQLALRDILVAVLDFARLKSVFSPNDERLLKALQALMPAPGDTGTALLAVTGWDALSLTRLVAQFGLFFGGGGVSALSDPGNLQRVYDAAIVLRVSGVSAAALIAATTNEPGVSTTDGKDHLAAGPNVFTPVSTANIAVGSALVIGAGAAKESVTVTAVTATTFSTVTLNPHNGTAMPFPIVGANDVVGAFQAAIRARYAEPDWITVITPINHVLREMQRDALVVNALQALARASQPVTVDNGAPVNTADTLFEYLLMDVQMGACMETSRIRHALSSVQLFAERAFLGLELNTDKSKNVDPALFKASEWVWMKRYRLWQANREVFLWPENWLYPELRDDQSPIFKDVIGKLLQKDISADGATDAYLQYLADLQKIAKLDPSGICYDPSTSDVHVVSRSMDGTQTYYYRKFIGGSWWPWDETGLKIEDNPVLPVLWNGRLLLFWLQLVQQNPAPSQTGGAGDAHDQSLVNGKFSDAAQFAGDVAASQPLSVAFNLCWSEYYNGKWQAAHISNAPCTLDNFPQTDNGGLDRPQLRLDSYAQSSPDPTRLILVVSSTDHGGEKNPGVCAFALYNTHSQPVAYPDSAALALQAPSPFDRAIIDFFGAGLFCQYRSGNTFSFEHFLFVIRNVPVQSGTIAPSHPVPAIYWWQNQDWTAPFFYSDTNNAFYVEADRSWPLISVVGTYGLATPSKLTSPDIPPLILKSAVLNANAKPPYNPVAILGSVGSTGRAAMTRFISRDAYIARGLGTAGAFQYGGRTLGPSGGLAD